MVPVGRRSLPSTPVYTVAARVLFAGALPLFLPGLDPLSAETISGKVFAPGGAGAAAVSMTASPQPAGTDVTGSTDGSGNYSLNVGPGCYRVTASSPSLGTLVYPDTVQPNRATIVNIYGGQSRSGVDFHFEAGHSVSGTLSVSTGSLPASVYVGLTDRGGNLSVYGKVVTTADWDFTHVPPGNYLGYAYQPGFSPSFSPRYYVGAYTASEATPIMLAGDMSGVDIQLTPVPRILGMVSQGGFPLSFGSVAAFLRGETFNKGFASTDGSGNYTMTSAAFLPGIQMRVLSFGSFFDPSKGGEDGTSDGFGGEHFTLVAGDNPGHDIDLPDLASASGTVTEEGSGTPIQGTSVFFDPAVLGSTSLKLSISPAGTNASGNFTYRGLTPGRYLPRLGFPAASYHFGNESDFEEVGSAPVTGISLTAALGGKFGGTVTQAAGGAPVPSTLVQFYDDSCALAGSEFTAGNGTYLSDAFRIGNYRLRFAPPLFSGLAESWYGGGTTCANAGSLALTAGNTTTAAAALSGSPAGTFITSGAVEDVVTKGSLGFSPVFFENRTDGSQYFTLTDSCGWFYLPGLTPGAYDAFVSRFGYKNLFQPNSFTISSSNVTKKYGLTALKGSISGHVTSEGQPVQGARVCALPNGGCDLTDLTGKYRIPSLSTGTYRLGAALTDGLEADDDVGNVFVLNGEREMGHDIVLSRVGLDPQEPDATGTPTTLSAGVSLARAFRDAEDVDWVQFSAIAGINYRLSLTGATFGFSPAHRVVLDAATQRPDPSAAEWLFSPSGWMAPTSGDRWIGLAADYSGSYSLTLQTGAPPPTVESIAPNQGLASGGDSVTIKGTGFASGAQVLIGDVLATNVVVVDPSTITARVPALFPGSLNDVVVTNPGMISGTLKKGWMADFLDVPKTYLYYFAIAQIFRAGITTGCGGGSFCPDSPVNRAAMAAFILRATHGSSFLPADATGTVFLDVGVATLLARWIEEFAAEGYTTGCGGGSFCPTAAVNRAAMAVFMLRALYGPAFIPPEATGAVFADVLLITFLARWIELFAAVGITSGCGGGNYCPNNAVTRGEMARFLNVGFLF